MTVAAENDQFRKQIEEMDFLNRKSTVKTKDAHVDLSNRKFEIVKEVQGDNIDKSRFKKSGFESHRRWQFYFRIQRV